MLGFDQRTPPALVCVRGSATSAEVFPGLFSKTTVGATPATQVCSAAATSVS